MDGITVITSLVDDMVYVYMDDSMYTMSKQTWSEIVARLGVSRSKPDS